jgi:hypothetical protein
MDVIASLLGPKPLVSGRNAVVINTGFENLNSYDQPLNWALIFATAAKLDVSSSSVADTNTGPGTGANKVLIVGLDANYALQTEEVLLNGQTVVQTAKSFLRVFAAEVTRAGTGLVNAGDIHIYRTGEGGTPSGGVPPTITSGAIKLLVGYGFMGSGMFTVPAGYRARLRGLVLSCRAYAHTFRLCSQCMASLTDNALHSPFTAEVNVSLPAVIPCDGLGMNYIFEGKTDIIMQAMSATAGGIASGLMQLELFK